MKSSINHIKGYYNKKLQTDTLVLHLPSTRFWLVIADGYRTS